MNDGATMTKVEIEAVLERVKSWPVGRQAYAALLLLELEQELNEPVELSEEELAELDQAEASGLATEAEVEALFGRYR